MGKEKASKSAKTDEQAGCGEGNTGTSVNLQEVI